MKEETEPQGKIDRGRRKSLWLLGLAAVGILVLGFLPSVDSGDMKVQQAAVNKCGNTNEGFEIRVGPTTSCELASQIYPLALAATYSAPNDPSAASVPKAVFDGVVSPITGQPVRLTCRVAWDGSVLSCTGEGNDPLVTFGDPSNGWHERINTG